MIKKRLKIRLFSGLCFSSLLFACLFTFALATQTLPPAVSLSQEAPAPSSLPAEPTPSLPSVPPLKPNTPGPSSVKTKEELLNEVAVLNREAEKMIDFSKATQKRNEAQKLIDQANQLKS